MPKYVVEALILTHVLIDAATPEKAEERARSVLRGQGQKVADLTEVVGTITERRFAVRVVASEKD